MSELEQKKAGKLIINHRTIIDQEGQAFRSGTSRQN